MCLVTDQSDLGPPAEHAVLKPGDTLVLRYARLTAQTADHIKARLAAGLPGVRVVILEADQMLVLSADAAGVQEHPGRIVR